MWDVSADFLAQLRRSHGVFTRVTYTPPGGEATELRMKTGSVSCTSYNIRRRGALELYATSSNYEELNVDGTLFNIEHGIDVRGSQVLVPVFAGELITSEQNRAEAGTVTLTLADLGTWIARCDFVTPWVIAAGTSRVAAIAAIITDARPGTTVTNTSGDTGTLATALTFTGSRWAAINQLSADGGTEAFFRPDGTFIIRDQPTVGTPTAWTLARMLTSAARRRPKDRMYNTVVVSPVASDGSQTWREQIVEITNTSHPRHKSKIGRVPYRLPAPTARTAEAARQAGLVRLDRVLGTTETLRLGSISNPALEGGDLLSIVLPTVGQEAAEIARHYVDGFEMNLVNGLMRADTRNQPLEYVA